MTEIKIQNVIIFISSALLIQYDKYGNFVLRTCIKPICILTVIQGISVKLTEKKNILIFGKDLIEDDVKNGPLNLALVIGGIASLQMMILRLSMLMHITGMAILLEVLLPIKKRSPYRV